VLVQKAYLVVVALASECPLDRRADRPFDPRRAAGFSREHVDGAQQAFGERDRGLHFPRARCHQSGGTRERAPNDSSTAHTAILTTTRGKSQGTEGVRELTVPEACELVCEWRCRMRGRHASRFTATRGRKRVLETVDEKLQQGMASNGGERLRSCGGVAHAARVNRNAARISSNGTRTVVPLRSTSPISINACTSPWTFLTSR
jgi:hypothetical protein